MYKRWQKIHSGGIEFRLTRRGRSVSKWYSFDEITPEQLVEFEEFKAWAYHELKLELDDE